jgi:predicted CXXCH cytochrome family protein
MLKADNLMTVISPQDNSLQTELTMNVVVKIRESSCDSIKIDTPLEQITIDLNSSSTMKCKNILLRLGENTISIRAYKNQAMVDEKIKHIYVSSQLHHEYKFPAEIYKQNSFHTDANEAKCVKCHNMSVNETKGVAFIDITKSNCYVCHKNIVKEKYAHAPAANWLCTSCHNIKSVKESKYSTLSPINKACFDCHTENQELWSSSKYHHEPLDSGHCNKCHNSHSSPYNMFLRKPVNDICFGCHKNQDILAMQGINSACEALNDGKLCITCHTPHASNQPFFLKKIPNKATK